MNIVNVPFGSRIGSFIVINVLSWFSGTFDPSIASHC